MEYKVSKVFFDEWMSYAQVGETADGKAIIGYGKLVRYHGADAIVELTDSDLRDAIGGCEAIIDAGWKDDKRLLNAAQRTLAMLARQLAPK